MAKQFFYISIGILALTISYHFGAVNTAKADWDPMAMGEIVGVGGLWAYTASGEAWNIAGQYYRDTIKDLPVPTSEVKFLRGDGTSLFLITLSDDLYRTFDATGEWVGPVSFPGGSAEAQRSSWGEIKREFR